MDQQISSAVQFEFENSEGHTEIFALHEAVCDGTANTLSGLLLVTVVASTVKETVTNFDGIVNHLQANINERSQKTRTVPYVCTNGPWHLELDQNAVDAVNQPQPPRTCHRPSLHIRRSAKVEPISSILDNAPQGWHLGVGGAISAGVEDHTDARAFAFVLLKTREDMMMRVQGQGGRGASEMY